MGANKCQPKLRVCIEHQAKSFQQKVRAFNSFKPPYKEQQFRVTCACSPDVPRVLNGVDPAKGDVGASDGGG